MKHMLKSLIVCTVAIFALTVFGSTQTIAQNYPSEGLELYLHLDLKGYADGSGHTKYSHACVWENDERRVAAVGTFDGTFFVDYTDNNIAPNDTVFFDGPNSEWRECRTYTDEDGVGYVYVTTEGVEGETGKVTLTKSQPGGLQIFRIEGNKQPEFVRYYVDEFNSSHTIYIDTVAGRAYVNGTGWRQPGDVLGRGDTNHLGGLRVLDIATDPENPKDLGGFGTRFDYPERYTHDSYVLRDVEVNEQRCPVGYSADIYNGWIRVLNLCDPDNVTVLDSVRTPRYNKVMHSADPRAISTHNVWATDDGKWLFATEETKGSTMLMYDISDPLRPVFAGEYRSEAVADSSIAHNVVVKGDSAYVSWYTEGVRVIDISDPGHPKEVAWFDSSMEDPNDPAQEPGAGMQGNWSTWADNSGMVIIVDMQNGLFILEPK